MIPRKSLTSGMGIAIQDAHYRGCSKINDSKMSCYYLPRRISAEENWSRASLKLNSSRGSGKCDADDEPLPTQILLFWLEEKSSENTIHIEMVYLLNLCQPNVPWRKPMKLYCC